VTSLLILASPWPNGSALAAAAAAAAAAVDATAAVSVIPDLIVVALVVAVGLNRVAVGRSCLRPRLQ
jgi:hypothetical protein